MGKFTFFGRVALAICAVGLPVFAHAGVIVQAPQGSASAGTGTLGCSTGQNTTSLGTQVESFCEGNLAEAEAYLFGGIPIVFASAVSSNEVSSTEADAEIDYSFTIVGTGLSGAPPAPFGVPFDVTLSKETTHTSFQVPDELLGLTDYANSGFEIYGYNTFVSGNFAADCEVTACSSGSFEDSDIDTLEVGATGVLAITASCFVYGVGSCTVGFDPIVTVDPKYAPYYRVVTSAVVPEPATWAMLIVGFAGIGFAGWRRGRGASRRRFETVGIRALRPAKLALGLGPVLAH
jgi:hypothetical protein